MIIHIIFFDCLSRVIYFNSLNPAHSNIRAQFPFFPLTFARPNCRVAVENNAAMPNWQAFVNIVTNIFFYIHVLAIKLLVKQAIIRCGDINISDKFTYIMLLQTTPCHGLAMFVNLLTHLSAKPLRGGQAGQTPPRRD